jgi:hypothetical protein
VGARDGSKLENPREAFRFPSCVSADESQHEDEPASVTLRNGELLVLDGAVLHDIEAKEESAFLLTISWRNGTRHGREPAEGRKERTFDEDALLRMEDEGASNKTPKWT